MGTPAVIPWVCENKETGGQKGISLSRRTFLRIRARRGGGDGAITVLAEGGFSRRCSERGENPSEIQSRESERGFPGIESEFPSNGDPKVRVCAPSI